MIILDKVNLLYLFRIMDVTNKTMPNDIAMNGINKDDLAKNTTYGIENREHKRDNLFLVRSLSEKAGV